MQAITDPTENRAVCGMRSSSAYPPKRRWPMLLAPARTELVMFFAAPFCSRLVLASAALRCFRPLDIPLFCLDCFSFQPQSLSSTLLERQSIDASACCIGGWRLVVCPFLDLDNFMRRCCRNTRYIEVGRHNSIGYFVSTHHTFTWWTKRCPAGERRLLQNGCATLPKLAIAGFSFHRSTSAVRQHLTERR